MKRLAALVFGLAVLTGGLGAARADEPLAGASEFATSHGQPFCQTRAQLQSLLDAQIAQADIGFFSFPGCRLVTDNSLVIIGQDFRGGPLHAHGARPRHRVPVHRRRGLHVFGRAELAAAALDAAAFEPVLLSRSRDAFGVLT